MRQRLQQAVDRGLRAVERARRVVCRHRRALVQYHDMRSGERGRLCLDCNRRLPFPWQVEKSNGN